MYCTNFLCTTLQRWTRMNISELNWVSSCQEWGGTLHKISIMGVKNLRWVSPPCSYPFTGKYTGSYTPRPIPSIFFSGPFLPWDGPCWIGRTVASFSHTNHIDWRYYFMIIYFSRRNKNQEELDRSTPWHMQSKSNNSVTSPLKVLVIYKVFRSPENYRSR